MNDESVFQKMDEDERIYAPEELPAEEQGRVRAEAQHPGTLVDGTAIPSAGAAAADVPADEKPEPGAVQELGIAQGFGPVT